MKQNGNRLDISSSKKTPLAYPVLLILFRVSWHLVVCSYKSPNFTVFQGPIYLSIYTPHLQLRRYRACFNLPVFSNESEEDYLDMAASYSAEGDYASAMQYLDNILRINPSNTQAQDLKRGLTHVMSKDNKTFVSSVNPMVNQEPPRYQAQMRSAAFW